MTGAGRRAVGRWRGGAEERRDRKEGADGPESSDRGKGKMTPGFVGRGV